MRIALTGASGHVGRNVLPLLLQEGHEVRILAHRITLHAMDGVELYQGDIANAQDVKSFVKGTEAVIHLAAKISIDGDRDGSLHRVNALGTQNLVQAAQQAGVRRFIHFSTIHAYNQYPLDQTLDETRELARDQTAYDRTKMEGERAVIQAGQQGMETVILAPTSIVGPNDYGPSLLGQAIIDMLRRKMPALVPGGFDFVDVRDVAKATIQALKDGQPGEKYLISGTYYDIKELAARVGEVSGVKVTQRVLPAGLLYALVPLFRAQSRLTRKEPLFTRESLRTLLESNRFISSAKANRHFGYRTRPFEETIRDTVAWFEQNGHWKRR